MKYLELQLRLLNFLMLLYSAVIDLKVLGKCVFSYDTKFKLNN